MLEFTLSRVVLVICGIALLGAVLMPVQSMYDSEYDASMNDVADKTSFILDEFRSSQADTLTLRGWDILPSSDSYLEIDGHTLTIYQNDRSYRSAIADSMESITLRYNEEITIVKNV